MSVLLARAVAAAKLDLLLLGALADRVRIAERGEVVRLHLDRPLDDERTFGASDLAAASTGMELVRRVAEARLGGARGLVIRVDAEAVGLPIAQMALAFGADELIAPIRVGKLALEVYTENDGPQSTRPPPEAVLRERELCALIRVAGRVPRIVEHRSGAAIEREPDETTVAVRRFRAPGREAQDERSREAGA